MDKRFGTILLFSCFAGVLVPARAMAVVPQTLTQQGRLLNADGTPVTVPVRMIFSVYDTSSATMPLWTETQSNVMVDNGAFSVQLGSVTPFPANVWNGPTRYLGVTVGNDPEMTPREQITSVPYALMCAQADHASAADTAATASALSCSGCVTPAMIQTGSLSPKPSLTLGAVGAKIDISITTGNHDFACASCSTGVLVGGSCWWDVRQQGLSIMEADTQDAVSWCCSFNNASGGTNVGHARAHCLTIGSVP